MKRKRSRLNSVAMLVSLGVAGLAIAQELSKPADARTWHGRVLGFIPYEFRPPTLDRIKASFWNPDDPHLLTSQVFGVGWSINLYQVARQLGKTGTTFS